MNKVPSKLPAKNATKSYFLLVVLGVALLLRLYRITNPVADWHAFRQADTASVTREYVKAKTVDILRPQYQDLSNIQSGHDNLAGYRMVEFPFINAFLASILRIFPQLDLVIFSRLASVFISLGTLVCLYLLVRNLSGERVARASALAFAILPYSLYYSRVILPEPYLLFFSTLSLWQFDQYWRRQKPFSLLISLFALILAALLKPFVAFLGLVYLALLWQHRAVRPWRDWRLYLYPILAFLPLLLWRRWILQFPSGIAVSDWLFNSNGIRFRPAWFRWLFYERLTKLFLGFFGWFFFLSNLTKKSHDLEVYAAWWLGILLYFSVIATGNVQHDYYQNLALPIICISLGRGAVFLKDLLDKKLRSNPTLQNRLSNQQFQQASWTFLLVVASLSWLFAWQQVKGYYNINHYEYIEAGKAVDQLTPADSKVIAPAMGDTQFLFQTNRRGWPIGFEIEDKIAKGATVYVSTTYDDEARTLEQKYATIQKTDKYIILDLTKEAVKQ